MVPLIRFVMGREGQLVATLLALGAVMQWVVLPIRERNRLIEARIAELKASNATLRGDNERLAREVRSLQDDPIYIEHVLRHDLRYVRPGEQLTPPAPAPTAR